MPHLIVGTAGHIDHGKTSLVKALTGIDADRLKEEKERGITIDLGFAGLALDPGTTIGFVDVPGHERFVKNMLAGVGGIDAVMLAVAADEAVMPQTREHLDICSLLRVRQGFTVLTKIDAADPDIVDLAEVEVREYLKGTFLEGAPVLRASSKTGEGIPELLEVLGRLARRVPPRDASEIFRLPIDRAFTMKGFGTVVSGTLIAGRVRRDEEVEVLPAGRIARVRGVQVHGSVVEEAIAGQRTALNLQRVELADLERGMVLAPPGVFRAGTALDVHLELLASAPAPIVRRKRIRFHLGTTEVMGHVVLLGQDELTPGGTSFAQILLERPAFGLPGDRFIVRQYSPMITIGGGEIIDAHPPRHRRSEPAVRERLAALQRATVQDRVLALVEDAGLATLAVPDVVRRLGVPEPRAAALLLELARAGRIDLVVQSPPVAVPASAFAHAARAVADEVRRFHETDPLVKGIGREELKGRVLREATPQLFRAVLDRLGASRQLAVDQDVVHVFGRTVSLGGDEARMREQLLSSFRRHGLQPPPPDDVIAELGLDREIARKILQLMVKEQEIARIGEELMVHRDALRSLIESVKGLKAGRTFGVKEFKELTGLSRKFAVPLLEYLDAQRVTRRVGDDRLIL